MAERIYDWIEAHLPWFDSDGQIEKDKRAELVKHRAVAARMRAEKVTRDLRSYERVK